ncbi:ParB/RepB/Spo0J family partition protein [Aestuariivita sp.]|jgi:hypothetical protein|uniref:ParB/RepB/Spo0J family partition protein n=1 Tax=Aestuariivita sp. TaxID=1872407 RepID=UPI002170D37C|nr:ParB/RepB/Spo0J family partition protein [Aestuariivita sp.]MCE8009730.1 ParB N-terminal domain-containing protein [Aestuariivita sp.]
MAKRKRLTPARPGYLEGPSGGMRAPETKSMPLGSPSPAPIAQVAGHASATAALQELSARMATARREGRLIEALPLEAIDEGYLMRDRIEQDADELASLMDSLRARGQQTAIEVIALPEPAPDGTARYGLISGWRRLTALKRLYAMRSESEFATIKALIIAPETAQAAYVAMVEENEIRVNLSLYERARIALRTVHEGVYPTARAALQGLYGAATRSKRSKIGSFMTLVEPLDQVLRFPTAIPERLGLSVVKAIGADPDFAEKARVRLRSRPPATAEEELRLLADLVAGRRAKDAGPEPRGAPTSSPPDPRSQPQPIAEDLRLRYDAAGQRVELTGARIDAAFVAALKEWLARG